MVIDDIILGVLATWIIPLALFVYYAATDPVPGARWRRRFLPAKALYPITRILLAQKIGLIGLVVFILVVRYTGGFPGREWVAFGVYIVLVTLAWVVFVYLRHIQKPTERNIRDNEPPTGGSSA